MQLVILGGGVAGLSAWRRALAARVPVTLVERCPRPGGLTRSIHVGGYTFDYTGHFLHLAKIAHPGLLGTARGAWRRVARRAGCLVDGQVIPAPFQYHLGALPEPARTACIDGVRSLLDAAAPVRPESGEDLPAYFERAFGPGVTAHFLKPYNEKLLATDLTKLSAVRLNRFFPAPDPSAVRAGLDAGAGAGVGTYNATFWYPEGDGIGRLVEQLTPDEAHVHATVTAIDPARRVVIADGRELPYTHLISTIPLPDLLRACGGAWTARADGLSASGVAAFQLGVGGPPPAPLREMHWLYVADPSLSFFRVGCYSNVSAVMAPAGCHSLYVEVGLPTQAPLDWERLTVRVLADLARAGLLDPARVEVLLRHALDPAYVHFDFAWEQVVPAALMDLAACGIHCAGRFGRWDYLGMEDVILESAALVDRLLFD